MRRDLVFSLSLGNLCFLGVWKPLIDPSSRYGQAAVTPTEYLAIALAVLLLAATLFAVLRVVRRLNKPVIWKLARVLFGLLLLFPLNALRMSSRGLIMPALLTPWIIRGALLALGVLCLSGLVRRPDVFVRIGGGAVLVLSPMVPLLFATGAWSVLHQQPEAPSIHAPPLPVTHTPRARILWLLFDELDQRLIFRERPASVRLPELDRFRNAALFASNAFAPANWTVLSVPSLLTGSTVTRARAAGRDELMITYSGSEELVPWSVQPNVFSRARQAGFGTAVVGWYNPYCRLLGNNLCFCSALQGSNPNRALSAQIESDFRRLFADFPFGKRVSFSADDHLYARDRHLRLLADAKRLVTDRRMDLIFVHWSIPHGIFIYDRFRGDFALDGSGSYLDNLVLVDRTIGELREVMERAGVWQEMTILISSDHALRHYSDWGINGYIENLAPVGGDDRFVRAGSDRRVPFLLKLARHKQPLVYGAPFSTILSQGLVLAVLRGEVTAPQEAIAWLDQHRRPPANLHQ